MKLAPASVGRWNGRQIMPMLALTIVTMGVMLTTAMVVKGYADGGYTLESTAFVRR